MRVVAMRHSKTCGGITMFIVGSVCTLAVVNLGCKHKDSTRLPGTQRPAETQYPVSKLTPENGFADQYFGINVAVSGNKVLVVSDSAGPRKEKEIVFAKSVDVFDCTLRKRVRRLIPLGDVRIADHWRICADDRWAAVASYSPKPSEGYVFDLRTGRQKAVLKPYDDLGPIDMFGSSISLKGERVIVGAATAARGDDTDRCGAAYVFRVEDGRQIHKLVTEDARHGDVFGCSVAMSDSLAVVGASGTETGGVEASGAAYVFDIRTGKQISTLRVQTPVRGGAFGEAVAMCGDVAVIGAPRNSSIEKGPGTAYLYNLQTGKMLAELNPSDRTRHDLFGAAVGISERLVVVGAAYGDSKEGKETGAAYVFDAATGESLVTLSARDLKPGTSFDTHGELESGSMFGMSVGVTADWIAVGAPVSDSKTTSDTGAVYLFRVTDILSKPATRPATGPAPITKNAN